VSEPHGPPGVRGPPDPSLGNTVPEKHLRISFPQPLSSQESQTRPSIHSWLYRYLDFWSRQ